MVLRNTILSQAWLNKSLMLLLAGGSLAVPTKAQPGVSLYTIPVVFHVLHQNGNENISDAQIADGLDILNAHFDAPTVTIDPPFDALVGDMDIAFVLATTAPDGSPTTGIDRIETALTNGAGEDASYINPWPRNRYFNIWVVRSLVLPNAATITRNPATSDSRPCTDGIMVLSNYVGSMGTGSLAGRGFLTQAVGMFFNLKMLYQDPIDGGPCADDDVADTPPCVPGFCLPGPNTCAKLPVNEQNFMHGPYASRMFTLGQRERVHACLGSPVAQRNELASGTAGNAPACVTTSVPVFDRDAADLVFSPMPFHDRIIITGLAPGRYGMTLQDMSGRLVPWRASVTPGEVIMMDEHLPTGLYIVVLSDRGTNISRLLMKN